MSEIPALQPFELARRIAAREPLVLLDVREDDEWALCHIEGSLHIPMSEIARRQNELDPERPTVCICHHGLRSANVALYLKQHEFAQVYNLSGGIDRWAIEVDRQMRRYGSSGASTFDR